MTTPKKETTLAELQALITGIPQLCVGNTINVAGTMYTAAQAVAVVTTLFDAENAVPLAQAALKAALQNRKGARKTTGPLVLGFRQALRIMYSNSPTALAQVQVRGKKPRTPLSNEAQLTKQAKASSTRLARGTKSKKQKSKIFGNVTGVKITPESDLGE
jgi:hypothetical protein